MTTTGRPPHTFHVPGVSCDHCTTTIETSVTKLGDVTSVVVDLDAKTVTAAGGDPATIVTAIEDAGYEVATG